MAGPQRKSLPDIYTLLLAIALVAMIVCIIMLYMETAEYGQNKSDSAPRVVQLIPMIPMIPTDSFNHSEAICSLSSHNNKTGCMDAPSISFLENGPCSRSWDC